jgi:hypothetical protein
METVQFPPSDNCTANKPCHTVMGEIMRVEETYVIKQANGSEMHVHIQPETNIRDLHKTGDKVVAQLSSRGVAHSVVKLKELPNPGSEAPGKTLEDLRWMTRERGTIGSSGRASVSVSCVDVLKARMAFREKGAAAYISR